MSAAIQTVGLSKRYTIPSNRGNGSYTTLRDSIMGLPRALLSKKNSRSKNEFWALQDINFEIQHGEILGIIGHNGAGKSTLLKILSRITDPTEGAIDIRGRVSSLLEVGTGFHPELTGRENIFLNGAINGMRRWEIRKKFDDIVSFAGVSEFLDTPCKHYSSGMYMRLAFAVAAHLDSEIMLVDEVLAVGDADFQKRCLSKMEDVRNSGKTILFVSHNMTAISNLCSRAILLEKGQITFSGNVKETISKYSESVSNSNSTRYVKTTPSNSQEAWIENIEYPTNPSGIFSTNSPLEIQCDIVSRLSIDTAISIRIKELDGNPIYHFPLVDSGLPPPHSLGSYRFNIKAPALNLYPGTYQITVTLSKKFGDQYSIIEVIDHLKITIEQDFGKCKRSLNRELGLVHTIPRWSLTKTS